MGDDKTTFLAVHIMPRQPSRIPSTKQGAGGRRKAALPTGEYKEDCRRTVWRRTIPCLYRPGNICAETVWRQMASTTSRDKNQHGGEMPTCRHQRRCGFRGISWGDDCQRLHMFLHLRRTDSAPHNTAITATHRGNHKHRTRHRH